MCARHRPSLFGQSLLPPDGACSRRTEAAIPVKHNGLLASPPNEYLHCMPTAPLATAILRRAPKVLLHEHLDGGLRPQTCLDLAEACGYRGLPTDEPDALAASFAAGADRKSLALYLEGFGHTIALMQTAESLARVAQEAIEDLAGDGLFQGFAGLDKTGKR